MPKYSICIILFRFFLPLDYHCQIVNSYLKGIILLENNINLLFVQLLKFKKRAKLNNKDLPHGTCEKYGKHSRNSCKNQSGSLGGFLCIPTPNTG